MSAPPVAIVHDYLTQRGGAERVVLAMTRAFPGAPVHTTLYEPVRTFPEFAGVDVRPGPLNRAALLRRHHRVALPLLAPTVSRQRVEAGVVLVSSSGWAHGVATEAPRVVYCHSPARWLYAGGLYAGGTRGVRAAAVRAAMAGLGRPLRAWDRRAAARTDRWLVNSQAVRDRVRAVYRADAEVLPPPPGLVPGGPEAAVPGVEPGFWLCVSRLLPYKNLDALLGAAQRLPREQFVVAGDGPESARLRAEAPPNVTLLGRAHDAELRWLYAHCLAVVAPSHEDFGLVPVEAAGFGKAAAALRWGGFLDTVREGDTGVFFDAPEARAVADAICRLRSALPAPERLREHAAGYGEAAFRARLRAVVAEVGHSVRRTRRVVACRAEDLPAPPRAEELIDDERLGL